MLFGLAEGETVVVRRRLILLDDQPNELTDTYFPVDIARGTRLAGTAKIPGGAVTLLAQLGHVGALVREDVTADLPDEDERETLQTAPGEPVLRLNRITLDRDERPIQADRMVMPAWRQRLRVVHSDDERPIEATVMVKAGHLHELEYEFTPE